MKSSFKKLAISILSVMLLINISNIVHADIGDSGNSGGDSGSGQVDSSFTWIEQQSGYRFAIIDENKKQVSNTVDILFSTPNYGFGSNDSNRYTNSRVKNISTDRKNWEYILWSELVSKKAVPGYPSYPIVYQGTTAVAKGKEFKEYFLAGGNVINSLPKPVVYTPPKANSGNSSQNNSYGTSKPDIVDEPYIQSDMGFTSGSTLLYNWNYRNAKRSESIPYVISQGNFTHAKNIISSVTWTINYTIKLKSAKGISRQQIYEEAFFSYISYCRNASNSNAEFVYMYSSIINNVAGQYWRSSGTWGSNDIYYANNNILKEKDLETLENIPLSDDFKGYGDKILNYKNNGKYLFKFTNGKRTNGEATIDVIIENNYSIIVEPIFWFRPANENGGYPSYPIHNNYVYGTVGNLIEFYKANPQYGSSGGAYAPLTHTLGYSSLYTSKNWGNGKIKGFSAISGRKTTNQLIDYLNGNYGLAMHVYISIQDKSSQQVTGEENWSEPAPPPDPSNMKEKGGYSKEYDIVKFYEDVYSDGTTEQVGVYYGDDNPHTIKINNELNYSAKRWFVSSSGMESIKDYKTYSEASNKVKKTRNGTGNKNIKLREDNGNTSEKTLVVLFQRKITNSSSNSPLDLTESQLSKLISTSDKSIKGWGKRNIKIRYGSSNVSKEDYENGNYSTL